MVHIRSILNIYMNILIVLVALAIINKNRRVDTYTVSYYKRAKVVTASCKITYYCTCYCSINVFSSTP